jgi:D-alanyl-D-alanine carboxypeptidase
LLFLALLSLTTVAFGPPALRERDAAGLKFYPCQLRELAESHPPSVEAKAFLLADFTTGTVILAQNEHEKLPPASLTKIMTAILALEKSSLSDTVVVGKGVTGLEPPSLGLWPGQKISMENLLYGLLLISANDAAAAIAEHIAGSQEAFVEMMNQKAAELGMQDTHFVNPQGFDAEGHLSTAYDLWLLTRYALANPTFAAIVSTRERGGLFSSNRFLSLYPGADGVKTGTTPLAGECLAASATRGNQKGVVILLNSPDRYGEAASLLDFYFRNYALVPLSYPALDLVKGSSGEVSALKVEGGNYILVEKWKFPLLRFYRSISSGELLVYFGDKVLLSRPLRVEKQ